MIKADRITKTFGKTKALDQVSLTLEDSHIFALIGSNGAGKSTLLRLMAGILKPDSGSASLDDRTVVENEAVKQQICYVSDEPTFLNGATIEDMGRFQAAYYERQDRERLRELCARFRLPMNERIAGFSKGTQKRVQICLALSRHPRVLLCDETFDGLDPVMRESFKRVLGETLLDENMTAILAGHSLQEMENICDSVGFLHNGKLVTSGDMEHILEKYCRIQLVTEQEIPEEIRREMQIVSEKRQGKLSVFTAKCREEAAIERLSALEPVYLEGIPLSLEEVFILEMEEQGYAE